MKKRLVDSVGVQRSSGNVFADLGLPDADKLKIKSGLVIEIRKEYLISKARTAAKADYADQSIMWS